MKMKHIDWVWMTHQTRNNGQPIPVQIFEDDGVKYYRPFDEDATDFELAEMDDQWAGAVSPVPIPPFVAEQLAAQPAPVQEPIGRFTGRFWTDDAHNRMLCEVVCDVIPTAGAPIYTTPPAAPVQSAEKQEPVAWVDLLKQAEEVVRSKSLWKKYIDGTPLANDIAVWMASFAQEHTTQPTAQQDRVRELECVIADLTAECKELRAAQPALKPLTYEQTLPMYRAAWAAFNDPRITNLADRINNVVRVVIYGIEAAHGITAAPKEGGAA